VRATHSLGGSPSFRVLLAPRISRGLFFLAVFVSVTHDGQSESGTSRNLNFFVALFLYCLRQKYKKSQISRHFVQFFSVTSIANYLFLVKTKNTISKLRINSNINFLKIVYLRHSDPSPTILH